jgi:predicted enzyme related to lactoylglutathione lyase
MEPLNKEPRFDVGLTQGQGVQIGDHGRQTNIFQLLASAGPSLSSHIRSSEFQTLIEERTRNFVGRDFIFKAIDEALGDVSFPSGYIVIRGEPGIGKTALIGELVKKWNCAHHFNISSQNIRSTKDFLSNVCAQLIVRYDLPHAVLPPHAISDSGFLSQLLVEASAKTGQQILILVDALDEADDSALPPGANCLYLPAALPGGVFFVVTSREEHDQRLLVDREKPIYLREDDPQNQQDVEAYITKSIAMDYETMSRRMAEWTVNEKEFVEILGTKSEGNFMYLVYVLSDIRDGTLTKISIDSIRNLPKGLKSYYQRHWRTMRVQEPERFEKYYEPVVCQLAVVREPVAVRQIEEWAQLPSARISEVIQTWRQFLNEDIGADGEPLFRLYHASFQEFLRNEVGLKRFHERIVDTALKKIPGFLTT